MRARGSSLIRLLLLGYRVSRSHSFSRSRPCFIAAESITLGEVAPFKRGEQPVKRARLYSLNRSDTDNGGPQHEGNARAFKFPTGRWTPRQSMPRRPGV